MEPDQSDAPQVSTQTSERFVYVRMSRTAAWLMARFRVEYLYRLIGWAIFLVMVVVLTWVLTANFVTYPGIVAGGTAASGFVQSIYGTADKPFVYRALLPFTVRAIMALFSPETNAMLNETLSENLFIQQTFETLQLDPVYTLEYVIAAVLIYLSLVGFALTILYLFAGMFRAPPGLAHLVSLIGLFSLPIYFKYSYIYDFPALFLFTLGLALMVRRRWGLYLVVFILGCINKETIILLTMVFFIHFVRQEDKNRVSFWRLLIAQVVWFVFIKLMLYVLFVDNPGGFVEFHLEHNIELLTQALHPYVIRDILVRLGVFVFLLFFKWPRKPKILRDSIWVLVMLLFTDLFFGWWDELRTYYEAHPIIVSLVAHTVATMVGVEITNRAFVTPAAESSPPTSQTAQTAPRP